MEMIGESQDVKRKYFAAFDYWNIDGTHGAAGQSLEKIRRSEIDF
jgi:hypothetical protein